MSADFQALLIQDNPDGWGPCEVSAQYQEMPYQPFSKGDRLGKVADWTGLTYQDGRFANKYTSTFGGQDQYAYFHEDDEKTFKQVFKAAPPKPTYHRGRGRGGRGGWGMRGGRGGRGAPSGRGDMQVLGRGGRGGRGGGDPKWQNKGPQNQQNRRWNNNRYQQQHKNRDASVAVRPEWKVLEEMDFARLSKLSLPNLAQPKDLQLCGAMEYYDRSFDRVTVKNEKTLERINRVFHKVTTTDDPVIRQLTRTDGNVFATDAILATLMCSTRSAYSWDIVVQKIGGKLFFDKRDDSEFDMLTVSETANETPQEEGNALNSPRSLSLEATFINHNFSQQVLVSDKKRRHKFSKANPFLDPEESDEVAPLGYRYRRWDLGNDVILVARTEHDAVIKPQQGEVNFINIKTLNEWDSRISGGVDWRQKLDTQRGAVLANELRCNANKLAKWTCQALLAGSHQIKFGYVSRTNVRDSSKHVILGTEQFKPAEFATQINLSMDNAWGILRCVIDMCMKLDSGKYLLMKDPNKPMIRLYDIPDGTFESDDEEEETVANGAK